jgi:hypothetical protein
MKYLVHSYGYTGGEEFGTIKAAKSHFYQLVESDKKRCRARFGKAFVHRDGMTALITLGNSRDSSLYSAHSIQKL